MSHSTPAAEPTTDHSVRRRARVLFALKVLVAAGLLTWLFTSGRLDFAQLGQIRHTEYLVLAAAALLAHMVLPVWRWQWLLRIQQLKIGWLVALRMTWLGYFAAIFLPGLVGGDVAKAYVACRARPEAKTRAVSAILMDRILGLHSLLALGAVAGLLVLTSGCSPGQAAIVWFVVVCSAASTIGLLLLLWETSAGFVLPLIPRRFRGTLVDSLAFYRRSWKRLVGIWLFGGLCNAPGIASYVLICVALGAAPTAAQALAAPLVIVANSLPISPGGLGVGETAGSQLFAEFGLANGAIVVLIVRLGLVSLSAPGILAMVSRPVRPT